MIVQGHQSIIDLSIQTCGSAEAAFDFALLNGVSITDDLEPGHALAVPDVMNVDVLNYYKQKGICPATEWVDNAERVVSVADTLISDETLLTSNYITVLEGQTLFDIALKTCGDAMAAYDLAKANGLSVSDTLEAGTRLIPVTAINSKTVAYYAQKGINPATSIIAASEIVTGIFDFTFDFTFE